MTAPVVTGSPSLDKGERGSYLPRYVPVFGSSWMDAGVNSVVLRACYGTQGVQRRRKLAAVGLSLCLRGHFAPPTETARQKPKDVLVLPGLFIFRRVHPVYCTGTFFLWHLAWNRALGLGSLSSLSVVRLLLWKLWCLSVAGASRSRRPPAPPIRSAFCLLLSGSKISMTAPVVVTPGSDSTMQFIMPRQFKKIRWAVRRFWFETDSSVSTAVISNFTHICA